MMRPHLRAFMPGTAARIAWKADERLMRDDLVPFPAGNSSIGATYWMPALLTRISTRAECRLGFLDHGADLVRLGHVGGGIEAFDAEILVDAGAFGFDGVGVAEAVDHDIGAFLGKGPRDRRDRCRWSNR